MCSYKDIAVALKDLIRLRLKDNPFPVENILIHVNNNLSIEDKFCTSKELDAFAESVINNMPFWGGDKDLRMAAVQVMLNQFWYIIFSRGFDDDGFEGLKSYYNSLGKTIEKDSHEKMEDREDKQWTYIRDVYLNKAKEQIIFNYKPAEIGQDDDPRTRKLRRDLIRNLGLITDTSYASLSDVSDNRETMCSYVFVVPTEEKGYELWLGVLKELVKTIYELSRSVAGLELSKKQILNVAIKKLNALSAQRYCDGERNIFDICEVETEYDLTPLSVFCAQDLYCWAPTVVLATGSDEEAQKGFIIYQDKDVGVAEMTEEGILLWRETILKVLSFGGGAKMISWDPDIINKADILLSIK